VTVASNVTTLAGCTPNAGSTNGIGDTARFSSPYDVAADSAGNLFVADYLNYIIRKATPGGIVTTLAGSAGLSGHTDANGSAARFFYPLGVAADTTGNVYVADTANQTIRMVTPSGDVTTLAGNPLSTGSADGSNSAARFYNPSGVAVDRAGNVFVADRANHTIRKITAQGQVTTLAGSPGLAGTNDGFGSVARFNSPYGVGVDQVGNILVADTYNLTIRRISPSGLVTTVAGTPGVAGSTDGSAQIALFNYPFRLACDAAGNIFVADTYNSTVRKITPSGTVTTIGGASKSRSSVEGLVNDARFSRPYGIAVDSVGSIYVADGDNNNIWKGTPAALLFDTSPEAINWSPSGFQFSILGLRGSGPVAIYVSTNLIQWDVLMMHSPATGTLQVMDLEAGNSPVRYYRASE
jgi:sugar lactone lactonase YvrE